MLVLFVTFLDNTIVAVALSPIQTSLHAGVTSLQWIVNAYALTFAALMLGFGTIGDHFGRRRIMVLGLAIFTVGSIIAATAGSSKVLIAARVIMGVGAAASEPGTLSMIRQIYPPGPEQARAFGIWSAVSGVALVAGPVFGGMLLGIWSWRAVFIFNIALGLIAMIGVLSVLPESRTPLRYKLDFWGFALGACSLAAATFATIYGEIVGYGAPIIIVLYALALIGAVLFWNNEQRAKEPVLDLSAFRNSRFTAGTIAAFTGFFAIFAVFFFVPLYTQLLGDANGFDVVIDFTPMAAALIGSSVLAGRWIGRSGAAVPIAIGAVAAASGLFLTNAFITAHSGVALFGWSLAIVGAGLGIVMVGATTSVLSSVSENRSGMAASTVNTSRELGTVAGVAIMGSIINGQLTHDLLHRLTNVPGLPPAFRDVIITAVTTGSTSTSNLPKTGPIARIIAEVIRDAQASFGQGLDLVMWIAASMVLATGLLVMLLVYRTEADQNISDPA